jgi:cation diffusion facilitator CzcD-associated flavoprotein CzcO
MVVIVSELAHVDVAIIGAGFGGLGTAIRLKQRGWTDFVVLERAEAIGGTWRDNSYPGCACDVPSHLYSFSFALNPRWTNTFSGQPEIWAYLRECVRRYDLEPQLRLGHEVRSANWDEQGRHWVVATSGGTLTARVLVSATGVLSEPAIPKLPGLESFAGKVFHSARWDHDHDLTGRRVAVIGTGASAIQFVPEIQPKVAKLSLFQRTPPWLLPHRSRPVSRLEHAVYQGFPPAQRLARAGIYWARELYAFGFQHPGIMRRAQRVAQWHLRRHVPDPALRAKLTPDYTMGCKRILPSNRYLPALTQSNVDVVTDGIVEVRPDAIVTADGAVHEVDTIILATGFHVTDSPSAERIRGRDGRSLAESWQGSPTAYLGTTVAGFPNLFLILGPNTVLGHTSVVFMAECQIEQLTRALTHLRRTGAAAIEPTPIAQHGFVREVDTRMAQTVWMSGGCRSWYQDGTGRVSAIWPGFTFAYRRRMRRFDRNAYQVS